MKDDDLAEAALDLYGEPTIYNQSMNAFKAHRRKRVTAAHH